MTSEEKELPILNAEACRVLGCLIEKAVTTPEYYPLTLNSLVAACNQKTNREPVTQYDEDDVLEALDELRDMGLALRVDVAGSRVAKFRHRAESFFELKDEERAILCVLLLRGPQTAGEIRARTERLFSFRDLAQVEDSLRQMAKPAEDDEEGRSWPLLGALPRLPGRKEIRYQHTLGGPLPDAPEEGSLESDHETIFASAGPIPARQHLATELKELQKEVALLRSELDETRQQCTRLEEAFEAFRRQLE
jgi:uncharacterized protein